MIGVVIFLLAGLLTIETLWLAPGKEKTPSHSTTGNVHSGESMPSTGSVWTWLPGRSN
jgi:hypothetical protein